MAEVTFELIQWDAPGRKGRRRHLRAKALGHKKTCKLLGEVEN